MSDALSRILDIGRNLDRDAYTPAIEYIAGLYPRGSLSIVAAQAGTGKTWFMQYIAYRLSVGGNILAGLVPKSKRYKTLIFAGETGIDLLNLRMKATCWEPNKEYIRVYDAVKMQINDIPIMLNTTEGKETFIALLDAEQPDLVFFDTLISFHTADESKQSEVTGMYTYLLKMAHAFNCAIVLNHHTRKRSQKNPIARQTQDDIIGSNAAVRLAAQAFILSNARDLSNIPEEDEGMPTIRVDNVKHWGKRLPSFAYQFITDEATGKLDFSIDWSYSGAENSEWSTRDRVQKLIESLDAGSILTVDTVTSNLVISDDSARKYLNEYEKRQLLAKIKLPTGAVAWKVKEVDEA